MCKHVRCSLQEVRLQPRSVAALEESLSSDPKPNPKPNPDPVQASEAGDPFKLKETVDEIREDLNPHPAGQKALNAPKKEELTGVQHRGTLLHEGPCS